MSKIKCTSVFIPLLAISINAIAWEPLEKKSNSESGASKKVSLTIDKFKDIPELDAFFPGRWLCHFS
jgi:hypothetical protein